MERRVRSVIVALLALTTPMHARSVFFTYDQWERLPIGLKEMYAGAVDALSTIAVSTQAGTAKYYNECLVKKGNIGTRSCRGDEGYRSDAT